MNRRIYLEEADRPPQSYFEEASNEPLKVVPFQTPDPQEWLNAPEFVPRSKPQHYTSAALIDTCSVDPFAPIPPAAFLPPLKPIPAGYSANLTAVQPLNGPPIAAILLKKKRKRRAKQHAADRMTSTSEVSSHPSDPNDSDERSIANSEDFVNESNNNNNNNKTDPSMEASIYDVPTKPLMDVALERFSGSKNPEIQQLDYEINQNSISPQDVLAKLSEQHTYMWDDEPTLREEMQNLRINSLQNKNTPSTEFVHFATIDDKKKTVNNSLIDKEALKAYLDEEDNQEQDYLEGLNIRINHFENCDEELMSATDYPQQANTSKLHLLQNVLKRNTIVHSNELNDNQRACCLIM